MSAVTSATRDCDFEVQRLGADLSIPSPAEDLVERQQAAEIHALLDLTKPVERHRSGEARIVAPEDDYVGDHKEHILMPFARPRVSRFSDGSFGVLYAGLTLETAQRESAYWLTQFFEDGRLGGSVARKQHLTFRATGDAFADIRARSGGIASIYDPDDYTVPHLWGAELRKQGRPAIYYDSVRHKGGECIGAFVPRIASNVKLGQVYEFTWNGSRLSEMRAVTPL